MLHYITLRILLLQVIRNSSFSFSEFDASDLRLDGLAGPDDQLPIHTSGGEGSETVPGTRHGVDLGDGVLVSGLHRGVTSASLGPLVHVPELGHSTVQDGRGARVSGWLYYFFKKIYFTKDG